MNGDNYSGNALLLIMMNDADDSNNDADNDNEWC